MARQVNVESDVARFQSEADNPRMWRSAVAVLLSAIFGSGLASLVYMFWSIWEAGRPISAGDFTMCLALSLGALLFTFPGALLLWAAQVALSDNISSARRLEAAIVVIGGAVGAAILGLLFVREAAAAIDAVFLGGFYGVTTALAFVVMQRHTGNHTQRPR